MALQQPWGRKRKMGMRTRLLTLEPLSTSERKAHALTAHRTDVPQPSSLGYRAAPCHSHSGQPGFPNEIKLESQHNDVSSRRLAGPTPGLRLSLSVARAHYVPKACARRWLSTAILAGGRKNTPCGWEVKGRTDLAFELPSARGSFSPGTWLAREGLAVGWGLTRFKDCRNVLWEPLVRPPVSVAENAAARGSRLGRDSWNR